ncbi:MAG: oligosaccharide flippase family protein [Ignavibacteriae bacterium]|nr:oligosaccharide flippase family protein [Ignavibacteriota bacterium]
MIAAVKEFQTFVQEAFQGLANTVVDSKRGIRDVLVLIIPQVATVVAAFVTSVLIARGLGTEGMGQFALILSLAGVAASLSDLGIGQTAIRFASRAASVGDTDGQMSVLRWAFRLRLALSVAATGLLFFFAPQIADLWKSPGLTPIMRIGLIGGIFTALASIPSIYFQSLKKFGRNASINVAQTSITLFGIVLLAVLHLWSVQYVVIVSLIAAALGALIFILAIPRAALIGRNPLPRSIAEGWNKVWQNPLSTGTDAATPLKEGDDPATFARYNLASTVIVLIILRLDVWLMGAFLPKSDVGIYNIATRFATPLAIMLTAIGGALWPRASSHLTLDQIRAMMKKTFMLCGVLAFFGTLYAIFVPILAPLLFGKAFEGSVLLGQVLCIRYAFAILIAPIGIIGYSVGMVKVYWKINFAQMIAVVLVNVILLPQIGPLASALALLVNEIIGVSLTGVILWKRLSPSQGEQHG